MAGADAGEERAWSLLAARPTGAVCELAAATLDSGDGSYRLRSFGRLFGVHPGRRSIASLEPGGEVLLERHAGLFRLAILWYLASARPGSPAGTLVRPSTLPGGEIYTRGTHVLPLEKLAAAYATRPEAFLAAGAALGGRPAPYGDAALVLPALPKVPTTLILWTANDEFPARADLLFDATAPRHLPADVLWAVAMLSILPFL